MMKANDLEARQKQIALVEKRIAALEEELYYAKDKPLTKDQKFALSMNLCLARRQLSKLLGHF